MAGFQLGFGWLICLFAIVTNVAWAPAAAVEKQTARPIADVRTEKTAQPTVPDKKPKSASVSKAGQGRFIVREGTRIVDQPGYFRISGDRIVFFSTQHNTRYVVLENLNLERIAGVMADQSDRRRWKVNGTLSEYRGDNYLLVEKVVLESWGDTVRHSP